MLNGEFGDDEWGLLLRFAEYANDLLHTKFVQAGMPARYAISYSEALGPQNKSELPDPDLFAGFQMKFRPFYLQNEPTQFGRICNLLRKRVALAGFRAIVQDQVEVFNLRRHSARYQVQAGGLLLNSMDALDLWLNGFEYHRDQEKRATLLNAHDVFPLESSVALFVDMLRDMTEAIAAVRTLIEAFRLRGGTRVDASRLNPGSPATPTLRFSRGT